jgi:uncharacterized membrane protein
VTEQGQPSPQRIGDAERDNAAELLREHMAQGRLTAEEFDERIDAALKARVTSDLDPLFRDLPGPRPGQGVATTQAYVTPPWQQAAVPAPAAQSAAPQDDTRNRLLVGLTAVMWPVTILLLFLIGWEHWWLIFIPVIISGMLGRSESQRDHERKRIAREQERLDQRRRALGE